MSPLWRIVFIRPDGGYYQRHDPHCAIDRKEDAEREYESPTLDRSWVHGPIVGVAMFGWDFKGEWTLLKTREANPGEFSAE
jgi:hypothetical protein